MWFSGRCHSRKPQIQLDGVLQPAPPGAMNPALLTSRILTGATVESDQDDFNNHLQRPFESRQSGNTETANRQRKKSRRAALQYLKQVESATTTCPGRRILQALIGRLETFDEKRAARTSVAHSAAKS